MSARGKTDDASDDEGGDIIDVDVRKSATHIRIRHNVAGRVCMCFVFLAYFAILTLIVLLLTSGLNITEEVRLQINTWREDGTLSESLNASIAFLNEYNVILANSNATVTVVREMIDELSLPAINATNDLAATLQALREHQLTASGAMPIISATLVADGA